METETRNPQNAPEGDAGLPAGGLNLSAAGTPADAPAGGLAPQGTAPTAADPRDARIAELERQLHAQSVEAGRLRKANEDIRLLREENERLKAAQPRDIMKDIPEEYRDRIDADQAKALGAVLDKRFAEEAERRRQAEERQAADARRASQLDMERQIEARWPGFSRDTNPGGRYIDAWGRYMARFGRYVADAYNSGDFPALALHIDAFLRENGISYPAAGTGAALSAPRTASPAQVPGDPAGDRRTYTFAEYSAAVRETGQKYREGRLSDADYQAAMAALNRARDEGRVTMT